jgi:putative phosphoesterase
MTYRIGVISDTHGYLHPQVFDLFEGVDLILHGGDVGDDSLLIELETIAPVRAVSGNVDGRPDARRRPLTQEIETPAGRIAMTHGHLSGAPSTELDRMVASFSEFHPDIVIYGHSHVPKLDRIGEVWVFNPGSAGHPRFGKPATVGLITLLETDQLDFQHKPLTRKAAV